MTSALPRQHRRCTVYPWCTGHSRPDDDEHRGSAHVVPAQEGRELRFMLTAVADEAPRVAVEVATEGNGMPLDVVELDPAEVLQAAAVLRQLALESRERLPQG